MGKRLEQCVARTVRFRISHHRMKQIDDFPGRLPHSQSCSPRPTSLRLSTAYRSRGSTIFWCCRPRHSIQCFRLWAHHRRHRLPAREAHQTNRASSTNENGNSGSRGGVGIPINIPSQTAASSIGNGHESWGPYERLRDGSWIGCWPRWKSQLATYAPSAQARRWGGWPTREGCSRGRWWFKDSGEQMNSDSTG